MKRANQTRRKSEATKTIERMNDLASAFGEAAPEQQQAALNLLDEQIKSEPDKIGRGWMTLFRNTFLFMQNGGGK